MSSPALVETVLNKDEILKDIKGTEMRLLIESLRSEVEIFYSRGSVADAIANLNQKHVEEQKTIEALQAITLDNKTDDELITLLKHREELMRGRALELIYKKIVSSSSDSNRLINKLRDSAEPLVRTLNTKVLELLSMSMTIFLNVMNDDFKIKFREVGGLRPLAKLLAMPELFESTEFVINLLKTVDILVTNEENREGFRTVNGVLRLTPFLSYPEEQIVLLATEALVKLAVSENNQVVIAKPQTIRQILKNIKNIPQYQIQYTSLLLLGKLALCEAGREIYNSEDYRQLLSLLDPEIYNVTNTQEYKQRLHTQLIVLDTLFEIAASEKSQKYLGQMGIIKTMQLFFSPMKSSTTVRWNFEILLRVLKIIDRVIMLTTNRNTFLELKGIALIAQILQNPSAYPEDCLMEAASILTTVATKATMNQQAYGKLGLQILLMLLKEFPTNEYVHDLTAQMINSVASSGLNHELILKEGADKILMMLLRESRIKPVLVNSCSGLASLCSEPKIVESIITSKVVQQLIALLQLNQRELQTNVARVLAAVADSGERGLVEIVKHGGIVPLVKLLSDPSTEVKEQALLTFGKILFAQGTAGLENVEFFFQAQGEKPLLECIFAKEEEVQVPALSIVQSLTSTQKNRDILRDVDIEVKLKKLEKHPNVTKAKSQVANLVRLIKMNLRKDLVDQRRERTAKAAAVKEEKKIPVFWLKITYEHLTKVIPTRDSLSYPDFTDMLRLEFGNPNYTKILMRPESGDPMEINDAKSLYFTIDCLKRDMIVSIDLMARNPTIQGDLNSAATNKLDSLLQRLTHKQLRILLKDAIDQGADLAMPIRQYITLNKNSKQQVPEDKAQGEPYGKGLAIEQAEDTTSRTRPAPGRRLATESSSVPGAPAPPAAPAPPPPPTLTLGSGKLNSAKKAAKGGDFMNDLKKAVLKGGNLKRVELDEDEMAKRGQGEAGFDVNLKQTQGDVLEDTENGSDLYKLDPKAFIDKLQSTFLKNYDFMNIVFQVIDHNELDFQEAFKMIENNKLFDREALSTAMLDCGFTVKFLKFNDGEEGDLVKKYTTILCPIELPVSIILKTIRAILRANGKNRLGGAIANDELEKLQSSVVQNKGGKEVVQGYWKKKKNPAAEGDQPPQAEAPKKDVVAWSRKKNVEPEISGGSLFDGDADKDDEKKPTPVTGYWARKKKDIPESVGSVWDD